MELWIRSQDKKFLAKVDNIFCIDNTLFYDHHENKANLGTYKTKERTLEVLDEIQNILQPIVITHEPVIDYDDMIHSLGKNTAILLGQQIETELKQAGQVVYQMPEN